MVRKKKRIEKIVMKNLQNREKGNLVKKIKKIKKNYEKINSALLLDFINIIICKFLKYFIVNIFFM